MSLFDAGSSGAAWEREIESAVAWLWRGGVAAIPTDTLYGLAADAFNPDAIERVFAIKERPEGLALPVLLSGWDQLGAVARDLPPAAQILAEAYWPGPLTLVLRRAEGLPPRLTAGGDTVAARVPGHPAPRELARRLGRAITGTSANISGYANPQSPAELRRQVGARVDCVVSGGPAPAGGASTIVDLTGDDGARLVREGVVPFAEIVAMVKT